MDPIHTLRAAKRLHLKDGCFVSLGPPSVFVGHLRAIDGKIAWIGPASAVERGESVLEVWGKVVLAGLPLAGIDPLAMACRAVPADERAAVRARLAAAPSEAQRAIATQALVECAAAGVLHPILDLADASSARARATVDAFAEVGLRGAIEWSAVDDDGRALEAELRAHPLVRPIPAAQRAPKVGIAEIARGAPIPPAAWLGAAGSPPDPLALVRALELRERGLGFRLLRRTADAVAAVHGVPIGRWARGAWFDACFLDYEVPAALDAANVETFLVEGFGAWAIEAAAVGGQPIVKRHEVLTADREALARDVAAAIAAARRG